MKEIITLLVIAGCLTACGKLRTLIKSHPDNFIEETTEVMLKETLNIDVEFTPESDQVQESESGENSLVKFWQKSE